MSLILSAFLFPACLQAAAKEATELDKPVSAVYLDVDRPIKSELEWMPLLPRELMRQAVLLSARENFGHSTRDEVLGDTWELCPPGTLHLHCTTRAANGQMQLTISRADSPDDSRTFTAKIEASSTGYVSPRGLAQAVRHAEQWSRKDLVEVFRDWGLPVWPAATSSTAKLPERVEQLLGILNEYAQIDALQRIHRQVRTEGESPELLGALVRGYGNLGQMCRYQATAREQVCYARSLLYAEKLVEQFGESPVALWHRAYARTMAGMDADALKDLGKARQLAAADNSDDERLVVEESESNEQTDPRIVEPPAWVPILEAFLKNQLIPTKRASNQAADDSPAQDASAEQKYKTLAFLGAVASLINGGAQSSQVVVADANKSLEEFLRYVLTERTRNIDYMSEPFETLIQIQPLCLRAIDGMADRGGVSNLHRMTVHAPEVHCYTLKMCLPEYADLPKDAAAAVDKFGAREWPELPFKELIQSLRKAAPEQTEAEISWAAVAQMIEDIQFVHAYRRAMFMKFSWGVPVDDFLSSAQLTLKGHRYEKIFEALRLDRAREHERINDILAMISFGDLTSSATFLFDKDWWGKYPHRTTLRNWAWNRLLQSPDPTSHDLVLRITGLHLRQTSRRVWFARELSKVNERSPIWAAVLVANDWDVAQRDVPQFMESFGRDPYFLRNLAERQIKTEQYDEAQSTLGRFLEVSPSSWGYQQLASVERKKGDGEQAAKTLEKYLVEGSDFGLSSTRAHVDLAKQYVEQGNLDEALAHAEAAAQSGAAWAMWEAAVVNERLERWERAEIWARAVAERYEGSRPWWYWWCRRTGRGDLAAARSLTSEYFSDVEQNMTPDQLFSRAVFRILEGDLGGAYEDMQQRFAAKQDPFFGVHALLLAHKLGKSDDCKVLLEQMPVRWLPALVGKRQRYTELADALRRQWSGATDTSFDFAAFDERLKRLTPVEQLQTCYFAAEVADQLGDHELAISYLRRSATPLPGVTNMNQILALAKLRELDEEVSIEDLPPLEQVKWTNSGSELYKLAGSLMDQGRAAEAENLLLEYIERTGNLAGLRRMARLYLQEGEFEKAVPFAERAAAWGDATGIQRVLSAHDALGNFAESERWAQKLADLRAQDAADWYLWCVRSNQGDLDTARSVAEKFLVNPNPPHPTGDWRPPLFFLCEGKYEQARERLQEAYRVSRDPWQGMHLAIVHHRLGEVDERNKILQEVANTKNVERFSSSRPPLVKLAKLFVPPLNDGLQPAPKVPQVEYLLSGLSDNHKVSVAYYAAKLYQMLDDEPAAMVFWNHCVTPSYMPTENQTLAYQAMRESGIDPYDLLRSKFAKE